MTKDTGGPAFPVQSIYVEDQETNSRGMTLRDYFAAKAMQAIVESAQYQYGGSLGEPENIEGVAEDSYAVADAMLKARQA